MASGNLLSISEAAELTPYSAEYLSLRARAGKLKAVKVGYSWLTTREAVVSYLRVQQVKHQKVLHSLQMAERRVV